MGGGHDSDDGLRSRVAEETERTRFPGEDAIEAEMAGLRRSTRAHSLAALVWALIVFGALVSRPAGTPVSLLDAALGAALAYIAIGLHAWRSEWLVLALVLVIAVVSAWSLVQLTLPPELRGGWRYTYSLLALVPWGARCLTVFRRMRSLRIELARARAGGVPRLRLMG